MIKMRMGEHHSINVLGVNRQGLPIQQAQVLVALKQATINQNARTTGFDQIFRASHGSGSAKEGKLHECLALFFICRNIVFDALLPTRP